jgi:hypothetical protein
LTQIAEASEIPTVKRFQKPYFHNAGQRPLLAHKCRRTVIWSFGTSSKFNLLRESQGIFGVDPQITHCALKLGVAKEKLNRP